MRLQCWRRVHHGTNHRVPATHTFCSVGENVRDGNGDGFGPAYRPPVFLGVKHTHFLLVAGLGEGSDFSDGSEGEGG